jgi:hypothetical protein
MAYQKSSDQNGREAVFILGLPRTGTTLVYQYIVHRLKVAYFTNGVGRFSWIPCLVTWLQHKLYGSYQSDFKSYYGKVDGPTAPREAGSFWLRYFPKHDYLFRPLSEQKGSDLKRKIACVRRVFNRAPFVNKNVKHLLRIRPFSTLFPDALFLVVERDMKDTALSLLRGRQEVKGDVRQWFSVRPPNYEELVELPPHKQVAHQVYALDRQLRDDLQWLSPDRYLKVSYKAFCKDPEALIDNLQEEVGPLNDAHEPINHFDISENHPENQVEEQMIEELMNLRERYQ